MLPSPDSSPPRRHSRQSALAPATSVASFNLLQITVTITSRVALRLRFVLVRAPAVARSPGTHALDHQRQATFPRERVARRSLISGPDHQLQPPTHKQPSSGKNQRELMGRFFALMLGVVFQDKLAELVCGKAQARSASMNSDEQRCGGISSTEPENGLCENG